MQNIVFVVAVAVLVHGLAAVHVHGSGTSLDAITSCSQLPYPEACRSLSSVDPHFGPLKAKTTFRDFNLQGATTRAQQAQLTSSKVDLTSFDPRTRAAWSDCLALASDTVDLLHSSLAAQSNDDSQTWLSAAATNIQACRDGFTDLGLAPPAASAMPILSTNISQLLSNSLAINKESYTPLSTGRNRRLLSRGGYPEWVSPVDRKLLQTANPAASSADLVVAKDGSGDYKSISEAVAASVSKRGAGSSKRFVIYVKRGVYAENVEIKKTIKNLMIIGDGIDATVVTGNKNVQDGSTTFRSATFAVVGDGFIARDITFENTAGPQKHQAVALRSGSDLSVFYRCSFKGYQDTLYVYSQRQFYRDCDVYGTVDFIFGNAAAVLQNCNIYVRKPMSNQKNTITAQGRTDPNQNTGISVHNSKIAAASDLRPVQGSFKTYLGRPWKQYSRTVFMKSNLDGLIAPAGWLEWSGNFALSTLYYGEYMNTGAGASTGARVSWKGFRVISNAAEAGKFTVGSFVAGNSWIPATGVPFTPGL